MIESRKSRAWLVASTLFIAACVGEIADGAGATDDVGDIDVLEPDLTPADASYAADAALGTEAACTRTIQVDTSARLASAISGAHAGDCLVLADGTYAFPTIKIKGTAAAPVLIRAQNRGKARVTSGNLVLEGATYVTVEGLLWTSAGNVRVSNAANCRISRFTFHPQEADDVDWVTLSGTTRATRIDHNDFGPKSHIGNMVMLSGKGGQIVQDTHIDHNYFHDIHRTSGNGWEAIRAGLSGLALSTSHTIIELNLFEHADGDPETISLKSSDNIVRWNTLRATQGEITLRHGNRDQIYGNFILGAGVSGSGGIRVCGEAHQIFDNYIEGVDGTGIFLEGGDSDVRNEAGTAHYRVHDAKVVFNTVVNAKSGIANGGAHQFQPVNSVVSDNIVVGKSGSLYKQTSPVNPTYAGNLGFPSGGTSLGMTVTAAQVRRVDPKLVVKSGVSRLAAGSPAIDAAVGSFPFVSKDIDGDTRSAPDVGADEFVASGSLLAVPLTAADVGPAAP
jgi:poly(beta-D-mannuronate) lyase